MIRSVGPADVCDRRRSDQGRGGPAAEPPTGGRLGFDETEQGKVALVVTEAATNLLKHCRRRRQLVTRRVSRRARARRISKYSLSIRGPE